MDIAVALSDYFHVTIDYLMCRTNQYCYDDKQFSELNQEIAQDVYKRQILKLSSQKRVNNG